MELSLIVAALFSLVALNYLYQGGGNRICVACGGRNGHREGCPNER